MTEFKMVELTSSTKLSPSSVHTQRVLKHLSNSNRKCIIKLKVKQKIKEKTK
jgi:hypothetical protein